MEEVDVLVVGAGPTGLMLASELARRHVPHLLIDAHDVPLAWDRATVVHPRSLEIFEGQGLLDHFLDTGVKQRFVRLHSDGAVLGELDLSRCGSRHGFNLGISEQVTEAILTEHLRSHGGEVFRSARLVGLEARGDHAVATFDHAGAEEQCRTRFVVGCDGLHSAVGQATGIELVGHDIARPWAVFDATLVGWEQAYEGNYVYLERTPVILTALPGHRWRVYTRPTSDDSDVVADALATIEAYNREVHLENVTGATRFRCHTKVADRYRNGPVLVAGDAAHVCSPSEGHGMNSGIQDAVNLGWKLALVCAGTADPELLDSYEAERRPVAERITATGDATEAAQTLQDVAERRRRDDTLRQMLAEPASRHHEAVAEAELDIDLAESPIVLGERLRGLWPGQRLPDDIAVVRADGAEGRLHELAGSLDHTLIVLAGTAADPEQVSATERAASSTAQASLIGRIAVVSATGDGREDWSSISADSADQLGIVGVVVVAVRPDGHIGLVTTLRHDAALAAYQRQLAARA